LNYIQPGKPQQNAYVERYNRTVRHEWLDLYIFDSITEVQKIATEWLWTYNHERPNMGIGGITPAQKLKMAARILPLNPVKTGRITTAPIAESMQSRPRLKRRGASFITRCTGWRMSTGLR
jgi:putative transposase